jgi:hypothetical protein
MAKKLKWGTIEYLEQLIGEYFNTEPLPSMAGLCLHLKITKECWCYYTNDRWRTHRKTPEEIELMNQQEDSEDRSSGEAFEDWIEISGKCWISEDKGSCLNIEEDDIKRRVSDCLKKAKMHIEVFINKQILSAKNPAGAIFYAKAALGYRETDPENGNSSNNTPTKITIEILPQPSKPVEISNIRPLQVSVDSDYTK